MVNGQAMSEILNEILDKARSLVAEVNYLNGCDQEYVISYIEDAVRAWSSRRRRRSHAGRPRGYPV